MNRDANQDVQAFYFDLFQIRAQQQAAADRLEAVGKNEDC